MERLAIAHTGTPSPPGEAKFDASVSASWLAEPTQGAQRRQRRTSSFARAERTSSALADRPRQDGSTVRECLEFFNGALPRSTRNDHIPIGPPSSVPCGDLTDGDIVNPHRASRAPEIESRMLTHRILGRPKFQSEIAIPQDLRRTGVASSVSSIRCGVRGRSSNGRCVGLVERFRFSDPIGDLVGRLRPDPCRCAYYEGATRLIECRYLGIACRRAPRSRRPPKDNGSSRPSDHPNTSGPSSGALLEIRFVALASRRPAGMTDGSRGEAQD